ncbi:hypothetical protein F1559_001155 [Cyanidiococcus yangmingshanensis]|uniref:Uncharacterized protein n=1 Tax=Cyanidiococcus yangmingshanensis TaxID=2690220 RepID=A0A7J7IH36_9RHOD|nr:hypothetical protein F1559_001155 [Cyanidiococcus yangmingshanensis]
MTETGERARAAVSSQSQGAQTLVPPGAALRQRLTTRLTDACNQVESAYGALLQCAALQTGTEETSTQVDAKIQSFSVSIGNLLDEGQLWLAAIELARAVHELAALLEDVRLLLLIQAQIWLPVAQLAEPNELHEEATPPAASVVRQQSGAAPSQETMQRLLEYFQAHHSRRVVDRDQF